ncbi:unnamed protein product [Natator depressus]
MWAGKAAGCGAPRGSQVRGEALAWPRGCCARLAVGAGLGLRPVAHPAAAQGRRGVNSSPAQRSQWPDRLAGSGLLRSQQMLQRVSPAPESVSAGACQILISLVTQPWIWTQLSIGARLHDGI